MEVESPTLKLTMDDASLLYSDLFNEIDAFTMR